MKHLVILSAINTRMTKILKIACLVPLLASPGLSFAGSASSLVDDFSNDTNNSIGLPRQFMNDTMVGGSTQTEVAMNNGVMHLTGEIVPPRGQPGWASTVLLLDETKPIDASEYTGIRMLVKINSGSLSISANSTEITNFDYHASVVQAAPDGNFHEVKIPFKSLKRSWSEPTYLNVKTVNSLSIIAFSIQKSPFDYEIDEVSFY